MFDLNILSAILGHKTQKGEAVMKKLALAIMFVGMLFAACASYRPIVDMKGVDGERYEKDLVECQQYAEQINPAGSAAGGAVIGAAFGAIIGGITGSLLGDTGAGVRYGAAYGAASGGASGAAVGAESQINIIRNCMAGRGYKVLN